MRALQTLRRFRAFVASAVFATVALAQTPVPVGIPGAWNLTFQDEFDGTVVDGAKWKLGQSDAGIEGVGGTNPANVSVGDGKLTLTATTAPVNFAGTIFPNSCAELSSYMRFKQTGGYFETRMRWDQATGMWPAFWMMPERDDYGIKEWFSRAFLKWDLTGSGVSSVTSAKLRLKTIVVGNDSKNPNCLQTFAVANDSWTESTVNWNNQPVRDPRYLDMKWGFDSAVGDIVEIDVTAWVRSQLAGDGVVSIALADEFRRYRAMRFHTREATNLADRPVLLINDSVSLNPVADAHVKWGTNSTRNYGSVAEVEVRTAYQQTNASTFNGGMELDIMETLGVWGNNVTSHAIHWDGYTADHQVKGWGPVPALATDTTFRTYGCYWVPGQLVEFYVDGVKTGSYTDARALSVPGYLILSLQLGGWDFNDPTAAVNNKTLDVDYVRAWSGAKTTPAVPTATTRDANGLIRFGTDYTSYAANANTAAEVTVADGGAAVTFHRDSWWKFPLSYTVTPDTVLEFTLDSGVVGEVIGLGLDEDDDSADPARIFQLAGSQSWSTAWANYKNYAVQTGPKRYLIPLGAFYTGAMSHLAFANDNDLGNKKVTARYSDVKIHEGPPDHLFAFARAVVGRLFTYHINADNVPGSYAATGLPPGLALDSSTGVISGLPTLVGDYAVSVTNLAGTGSTTLALRVLSPFAAWTEDHALTGELATPSADPDGDGHSNLLEYAFGLDPTASDPTQPGPLPTLTLIEEHGTRYLELGFTLPADRAELTYVAQVSDDLVAWTNGHAYGASPAGGAALPTVEIENILAPDGSRRIRLRTSAPTENARRFMRVRVTQP